MAKKPAVKAPELKPKGKAPAEAALAVTMPNAKAVSKDAGLIALKYVAAYADDALQIEDLEKGIESNRYKAQSTLVYALWNAGIQDKSINLADSFGSEAEKNRLGKQVRLALGMATLGAKNKIVWKPDVAKLMLKDDGDDERTLRRKESIRSNFSTMLTKSMRVALDAIESGHKVEMDKQFNTLRLTGPQIEKHFGLPSIVLNEDQNTAPVFSKQGKVTGTKVLKKRPSFTEMARRAAEAHGKTLIVRKDSRTQALDPIKHLVGVCGDLVKAIAKLPKPVPADAKTALEGVNNAIDAVL
jgi:hypothetical protein